MLTPPKRRIRIDSLAAFETLVSERRPWQGSCFPFRSVAAASSQRGRRAVAMPAHYALPIVVVKGRESALNARTERAAGSALNPLEPLDLNSSLRQGLPALGPISTNSISSGGRRRSRNSSRDLGAWGKPRSPRHNLSCANRPSPNRTVVVLTKSKPSATIVYEPPSPTEQVAPRVVPGAKKEVTQP